MDSFTFNKIAMAFLGTVFLIMGASFLSDSIFHMSNPEQKGYAIEVADASGGSDAQEEDSGPAFDPVTPLLASADASVGEGVFKKCASCHTVDKGGANKVGPALWDVVNRQIASHDGFKYSAALSEYAGGEKQWTYEELNGFLWKPKTHVKGTSMGFAGLKKVDDRAAVIAYLRSLSDNPAPLPE